MKLLSAKLPQDDADAKLMRFDNIRGQRYTEIFLIGGHPIIADINAGIYNTIGLNDPDGTGDTTPQAVLDQVDLDALTKRYDVLSAFKNGPRLWTLDWAEVIVGAERDFMGLQARWVMWLDVPKEFRKHESVAYKPITGKRDTQFGIDQGSQAFILDDPGGDSWVMKSASLIVDPSQTYDSLKDLGGRTWHWSSPKQSLPNSKSSSAGAMCSRAAAGLTGHDDDDQSPERVDPGGRSGSGTGVLHRSTRLRAAH